MIYLYITIYILIGVGKFSISKVSTGDLPLLFCILYVILWPLNLLLHGIYYLCTGKPLSKTNK